MRGFFLWHYSKGLNNFFQIWKNYLEFFWNYFSIGRFFRTLLSPWKRDVSRVSQVGFHPVLLFQALIKNSLTRMLGAIIKSFLILFGIQVEAATIILGAFLLIVWIFLPIALISALAGIMSTFFNGSIALMLFWFLVFFACVFFLSVSISSYRTSEKDYFSMPLALLAKEKWFERVWNRVGKMGVEIDENILADEKAMENFLRSLELSREEFLQIVKTEISGYLMRKQRARFWSRENLMAILPVGRYWTYAYTIHLDKYSTDLSVGDYGEYHDAKLIGKENELNELKQLLLRSSQNNVILVGEPGVGKDTLIHVLAREIRNSQVEEPLLSKRILELDIKNILADYASSGESDKILEMLFSEAAYAGNIILVLKNMNEYVDTNQQDISSMLTQFLAYPTFQIIGTTTPSEFHELVEKKDNIMKYCEKILVEEMGQEDTLRVLQYKLEIPERNQVVFTYQALREVVKLSDRYMTGAPFPEKALDLMEEVLLHWEKAYSDRLITASIVNEAVSAKIKVPLGELKGDESEKLLHLEDHLHKRIIGQNFAIRQISETMRRARIGMAQKNKPIGSFLFLGSTGVGKTESSKALAEAYFGDEERMIRLDMSEYQTQESIDRLIGSASGKKEGYLVAKVKESPYALLLLDEIEKAYPDILNLLLQVLDEGFLTDAFGKKINFRNLIIIATSNVGASIIKDGISNNFESEKIREQVMDYAIKQGIFRPEFLNRFEGVVFFHPLSQEDTAKVAGVLLDKYAQRLKKEENIQITFGSGVAEKITQEAYDPVFGARAIDRYIQDKIGDVVVKKIIAGELKKGEDFIFEASEIV